MVLEFDVKNQIISRLDDNRVVADSENYLYAHFTYTDDWSGTITAIFRNGSDTPYSVLLDDDNACLVPAEVIKSSDEFSVSLYCGTRVTANKCYVSVEESGYIEGETPAEPTPSVYEEIVERLDKANAIEDAVDELETDVAILTVQLDDKADKTDIPDIRIANKSIVKNKVANIPNVGQSNDGGLVKVTSAYGTGADSGYLISTVMPSILEYNSASNYIFISKGTLEKVLKSRYYTQAEVDKLINSVASFNVKVVSSLPSVGDSQTIYLVPKKQKSNDNYDEYLYVSDKWEHIGTTDIDLSNYVEKTDYATPTKAGVIKPVVGGGIDVDENGNASINFPVKSIISADGYLKVLQGSGAWSIGIDTSKIATLSYVTSKLANTQKTLIAGEGIEIDSGVVYDTIRSTSSVPTEYIKSASVNDNTLTLTKEDDSTVEFTNVKVVRLV